MNMKRIQILAIGLFLVSGNLWAAFFDGNNLHNWLVQKEKSNVPSYVSGLFDGYVAGVVDAGDGLVFCTGSGVTAGQNSAVVAKYINNNPEKWNKNADLLVVDALKKAFPCKK